VIRKLLRVCLVFLLVAAAAAQSGGVTLEARVFDIGKQLRCPICVSESVAASSSQIALTMREEIQELVLAGLSDQEILDSFTESYGDWVLLKPPRRGVHLLVWLLPVAVIAVGAVLLYSFMRRSTRAGTEEIDVSESDLERLWSVLEEEKRDGQT